MTIQVLRIVIKTTLIFITLSCILSPSIILSSEDSTTTPIPSKTPTPTTSATEYPTTESHDNNLTLLPYTQDDLNILSGNVQRPNGIAWHDNYLYTACNGDWTLYQIDDTSGATRTYIYGTRNVHTLLVEDNDMRGIDLWVIDYDTHSLLKVNQARAPQTITSNLEGPWGITRFDDESFLITSLVGNKISQVKENGEIIPLNDQMRSPTGVAIADEFVYVANNGSARRAIEWGKSSEVQSESIEFAPLVSGLQNVTGLTIGPDRLLYFAYALGTRGVVGRVDPKICQDNGGCTNSEVELVVYSELAAPIAGLTITPDMRLFLHTIYRPEIYWIQLESVEQTQ